MDDFVYPNDLARPDDPTSRETKWAAIFGDVHKSTAPPDQVPVGNERLIPIPKPDYSLIQPAYPDLSSSVKESLTGNAVHENISLIQASRFGILMKITHQALGSGDPPAVLATENNYVFHKMHADGKFEVGRWIIITTEMFTKEQPEVSDAALKEIVLTDTELVGHFDSGHVVTLRENKSKA